MGKKLSDDALYLLAVLDDGEPKYGPSPSSNYWTNGVMEELCAFVQIRRLDAPFADDRPLATSDGEELKAGEIDALIDHEYRINDAGRAALNAALLARGGE